MSQLDDLPHPGKHLRGERSFDMRQKKRRRVIRSQYPQPRLGGLHI